MEGGRGRERERGSPPTHRPAVALHIQDMQAKPLHLKCLEWPIPSVVNPKAAALCNTPCREYVVTRADFLPYDKPKLGQHSRCHHSNSTLDSRRTQSTFAAASDSCNSHAEKGWSMQFSTHPPQLLVTV